MKSIECVSVRADFVRLCKIELGLLIVYVYVVAFVHVKLHAFWVCALGGDDLPACVFKYLRNNK